jgi:hypothetical protein
VQQRAIAIVAAGPANFLLALLFFWVVAMLAVSRCAQLSVPVEEIVA